MKQQTRRLWAYLIPVLAFVAAALLVRPFGNFPINDDWVYARDVLKTLGAGKYSITGYESAWGVPQVLGAVLVARAFSFSHVLIRGAGLLSAALCLLGMMHLLLKRGVPVRIAVPAVLAFAFYPPMFLSSLSFMTDVPFLALWIGSVIVLERAYANESILSLACGIALSVLAIAQRQFGIAIPIAFALLLCWKVVRDRKINRFRLVALAFAGLAVLSYFAVKAWWITLPHASTPQVSSANSLLKVGKGMVESLPYLGFLGAGLYAASESVTDRLKNWGARSVAFWLWVLASVAFTAGIAVELFVKGWPFPYFGNLISEYGVFNPDEVLLGDRVPVFSDGSLVVLTFVGWVGGLLVLLLFFQSWAPSQARRRELEPFNLAGAASLLYLLLLVAVRDLLFDRYLLPVLPGLILLVSAYIRESPRGTMVRMLVVLVMAAFSVTCASDYFRWNEARWEAGARAVQNGVSPAKVGGGYEWDGWYHASAPEVTLSFSPLPGFAIVDTVPFGAWWGPHDRAIYLLKPIAPTARRKEEGVRLPMH